MYSFSRPQKLQNLTGTWNNQGMNASCGTVKFQVNGTTEAFAGTGIDDFFLFEARTSRMEDTCFLLKIICINKRQIYSEVLLTVSEIIKYNDPIKGERGVQ